MGSIDMKRYIIEFCKNDDSDLEWIVWDVVKNESPTGWLETKKQAQQFIKMIGVL